MIGGVLRVSEPPGGVHGRLAAVIAANLSEYVDRRHLGTVMVEAGYVLARDPDTVRGPDVSFVSAERLDPTRLPLGFIHGPPDLAIEIRSPGNSAAEVVEKVADYLRAGARAVWVVDPVALTVTRYQPAAPARVLTRTDRLDAEPVIPGFSCSVAELLS